jgi:orotate phosphoribosyltransferase
VLNAQRRLLEVSQREAVLRGSFKLSSGATSDYYIDAKLIMQAPESLPLLGELVWKHAIAVGAEAVGGLAAGCIPMSDAAVMYGGMNGDSRVRGFYVRATEKEHGRGGKVYQSFHPDGRPLLSRGRRVLIVDDVLTTGASIGQAIDEIAKFEVEIVGILVIIDRDAPESQERLKAKYRVDALFRSEGGTLFPAFEVSLGSDSGLRQPSLV